MSKVCIFKQFSNIFGTPGTGVHVWRLFGAAGIDYILTIIVACLTTYLTKAPLVITTIGWLLIGFLCHMLFGVQTNTMTWLGIEC